MGSNFQRTLRWVILVTSCFMLWDNWNVYNGKPSFFGEPATTQTEQTADAAQSNDGADSVPQTVGSGSEAVAKGMIDAKRPVEVSNDMLKLTIDEVGGVVTHAVLLKEHQQSDWTEVGIAGMILGKEPAARPNIELLTVSPKSVYVAQSGFIGGDFPNHKSLFKHIGTKTEKRMDKELGREVNVYTATFESTVNNVTVRKHYELSDGRYSITVRHELVNNGESAIRPSIYYQLTRDGNKQQLMEAVMRVTGKKCRIGLKKVTKSTTPADDPLAAFIQNARNQGVEVEVKE